MTIFTDLDIIAAELNESWKQMKPAIILDISMRVFIFSLLLLVSNVTYADMTKEYEKFIKSKPSVSQVNKFFNSKIAYVSDIDQFGAEDYWQTPTELLKNEKGDCEDYAIAKYFALIELGVPKKDLHLVYGYSTKNGLHAAHIVLQYRNVILDNQESELIKSSKHSTFEPMFAFNGSGTWFGNKYTKTTVRLFASLVKRMKSS